MEMKECPMVVDAKTVRKMNRAIRMCGSRDENAISELRKSHDRMFTVVARLERVVRDLYEEQARLKPVHDRWIKQYADSERQTKCRAKKKTTSQEAKELHQRHTQKNNPCHSLVNDINVIMTAKPSVQSGMYAKLKTLTDDPTKWLLGLAVYTPLKAVDALFSLYNSSFWVPWVSTSGESKMKVFRDWNEKKQDKAQCRHVPKTDFLMKVKPTTSRDYTSYDADAFSHAWVWKALEIVYRFVTEDLEINLQDESLADFNSYMQLMSGMSCYYPFKSREERGTWDPTRLKDMKLTDAAQMFRRVSPKLLMIRLHFLNGISSDLESFFTIPE